MVSDATGDETLDVLIRYGLTPGKDDSEQFIYDLLNSKKPGADDRFILENFNRFNSTVPDWVDFKRIENGRKVYLRHAPMATNVIFLAGLIGSYTARKGVKVLIKTGRLQQDILPRLYETAHMVANVLQKDALIPGNIGHATLVKVRLMHCGVRRFILNQPEQWDFEWGHPINQEDMCGTLTLFSYVVLKGLETLGIIIPEQDKEDYIHLWRYAGYLLGVDAFFIPENYADTEAVYAAIRRRQSNPDEDSRALVHAVIGAVAYEYQHLLPKEAFYAISRYFIGEELANKLELPQNIYWDLLLKAMVPFWGISSMFLSRLWIFREVFTPLGDMYIKNTIRKGLRGQKARFLVPGN